MKVRNGVVKSRNINFSLSENNQSNFLSHPPINLPTDNSQRNFRNYESDISIGDMKNDSFSETFENKTVYKTHGGMTNILNRRENS